MYCKWLILRLFTKGCAKQKCVLFGILNLCLSLWDYVCVETLGLGARAPQPEKFLTDFIYFESVSFPTSDVYWIARPSCLLIVQWSFIHISYYLSSLHQKPWYFQLMISSIFVTTNEEIFLFKNKKYAWDRIANFV